MSVPASSIALAMSEATDSSLGAPTVALANLTQSLLSLTEMLRSSADGISSGRLNNLTAALLQRSSTLLDEVQSNEFTLSNLTSTLAQRAKQLHASAKSWEAPGLGHNLSLIHI